MTRIIGAVALLAVVLAGCAADDPDQPGAAPAPTGLVAVTTTTTSTVAAPATPAGDTTQPASTEPANTAGGSAAPASAPPSTSPPTTAVDPNADPNVIPTAATVLVAELAQPVDLAVRPGDPAAYVVEQGGRVLAVDLATGASAPVLDIGDLTDASGEQGLLGLAFHPSQPYAYVNYTTAGAGDTVVAEYAVADDGTFDPASARTVLTIEQPYSNHNGGGLVFGPDGYLYVGTGDGGSGGDPERRASDPYDLLGKLLRIDPRGGDPYAVPADNPFADGQAAAPEVWSVGLRNPWRFGFDPVTGDLWIADVGQNEYEEVNRVAPTDQPAGRGANFGWSAFEGTEPFNTDVDAPDAVMPVLTYSHAEGCSVSGGMVYRGSAVPDLRGWYLFSDYCTGALWAFDVATGRNAVLTERVGSVTAVRPGADGEAYVLGHDGGLFRVTSGV